MLFKSCLDDVMNKKNQMINPKIFKRPSLPGQGQFKQVIPDMDYKMKKRGSVFQKIDIEAIYTQDIPVFEKSNEQILEITNLLTKIYLTQNLEKTEIEKIAKAMKPMSFKPGECIIKYGDPGTTYYILSKGSVQVTVYKAATDPLADDLKSHINFSKVMQEGIGFGELALLYNEKRSATIEAI